MQCQVFGNWDNPVSPKAAECAIRFSYAQAILSALYIASTGGMFMVGYALRLGANDAQIGLISTVPMFCVVVQLLSSRLIEKGRSRRRMTIISAIAASFGWSFIIALPFLMDRASIHVRIITLVSIIAVITVFSHVANNARSSWVGDLVPSDMRGKFFGKVTMYAGIVGSVFTILGGVFLDKVKDQGIEAFLWVFGFGMLCGLLHAFLFVPQPDMPVATDGSGQDYMGGVKRTFHNKQFMIVTLYSVIWTMQMIASPFYAAYMLRDLHMTFLAFSMVTMVGSLLVLISSPFWGKVVDHFGCKPVLVLCTAMVVPLPLVWIWINTPAEVYSIIPVVNVFGGIAVGGITVALNTLVYKATPDTGRSVQFAIYSIAVLLLPAPMPVIGGYLPKWIEALGFNADLRFTFFATIPFTLGAALIARKLQESDARSTREMVSKGIAKVRSLV